MKRISLKNIKLGYKSKGNQTNVVSKNLNVEFIGGKINVIIGESGCEKQRFCAQSPVLFPH